MKAIGPTIGITTLLAIPSFGFVPANTSKTVLKTRTAKMSSTEHAAGPEIEVVSQPDQKFLEEQGVFGWGTWGCDVSKFPWTYADNESCYLLKGQVTVTPTDGRKPATFGKGDFVTFPAGMSCTWDVSEAVHKHFKFF